MQTMSLETTAREQLDRAARSSSARAAVTVYGGSEHALRQTLLALRAGAALDEHSNPGEATVYVLSGRIEVAAGADRGQAGAGDLLVVPEARHALRALEDSVVLLTAVPRGHVR